MQFTVAKSAFLEALQVCGNAVPAKSTLPILQNFLLTVRNGQLLLTATDLDLGVRMSIPVQVAEEGELVVPARHLIDVVKELPDLPIDVSVKDYHLALKNEKGFSGKLAGVDAGEYPALPDLEGESFSVPANVLRDLSERTLFAVSTDQTRLALNGVYWEPVDGKMVMVATDGHRLGHANADLDATHLQGGVILPPKAIQQVLRVAVGEESIVEIQLTNNSARFQCGVVEIFTKLIEGPYPNYRQVVPRAHAREAVLPREEFIAAVRRVQTLASKSTRQIRLSFRSGRLEISAQNLDVGGEARDGLPAEFEGEAFDIGFNAQYLEGVLKLVTTPSVRLKMNSPVQACVVEPAVETPDCFFILMPLRLAD